jgi:hypothetical protein
MLIGADVGHPPQGNGAIRPSIAATVASTNGDNNNFKPCVRYVPVGWSIDVDVRLLNRNLCIACKKVVRKPSPTWVTWLPTISKSSRRTPALCPTPSSCSEMESANR